MNVDRQLVARIKTNLARKSSAQLQQLADSGDHGGWSAEALVAASELLLDRAAGRAGEPADPEEDRPPPSPDQTLDRLALTVGINAFTLPLGILILPGNRQYKDDPIARDVPAPFGPGTAWLALDTADAAAVAAALGLQGTQEATWAEGVAPSHWSSVFVTPPVGDWTLAVSAALFPPRRAGDFVGPLLERLSREFGEAQYFCTHTGAGLHAWARARGGRLVRGYGWLGKEGLTLWDAGALTREERDLGLRLPGARPPAAKQDEGAGAAPEEGDVLQLAACWSIDPTTLDEQLKEPRMGLLGRAGWIVTEPPAAADPGRP
jgi:hypothetical protein